jgi:hypothetical protein
VSASALPILVTGLLLAGAGCRERPQASAGPSATTPAPLPSAGTAASTVSGGVAIGSPAPDAPSPSASSSAPPVSPALARYPRLSVRLVAPCDDPRVVLAVRQQFDRSGRLWVQQALLANPELVLVSEKATRPGELDVYETIYGTKNFARTYPGEPLFSEAVIARCADVETCEAAAAMFHAVAPQEKVQLVCGVPAATTGGFGRVAELAPARLKVPAPTGAPAPASCARLHACVARESAALPAGAGDCRKRVTPALAACAAAETCAEVVSCWAGEAK